jgi:carbamoyl-phosphate synthase large subunit
MPKRTDIETVLVIGSGPIVIGQACEFDYSGTQALKALKEEGYRVVLVNSNPATIMTDQNFADRTYIEPITVPYIEKIIAREKPDVLLPTIGGQTALNVTIELDEAGVLDKYNVELIGASVDAIKTAEDRDSFKQVASRCGLESAKSILVTDMEQAKVAAAELGYPFIIRPSRTLGGAGGGIVESESELVEKINWGFEASPINELLLEESLLGWKEIELEVMRDQKDNAVVICGIENIDPMGVHTGDSITVAPILTLTDKEYQRLRTHSLNLLREIGVDTGGSNVQFAVCPKTGRQIVIEMNPRVSRSSALASKATGFPIAKIAAKLAVGYSLDELPNDITQKTPASFEPSIDYVVVKIPRFTFEKFAGTSRALGTQMKAVGESMAIGRTFAESLQKACRSLETGRDGLIGGAESSVTDMKDLETKVTSLSPERLFYAARLFELGQTIEQVNELTDYDPWFLRQMLDIVEVEKEVRLQSLESISRDLLLKAKRHGSSDSRIARLLECSESEVRAKRHQLKVRPAYKTVDTCAAEFASETPYLYSTYEDESESEPSTRKKIVILGGGPNRIGQGLEFDYCCVHAAFALGEAGYETIMVNCNPETVSTDYDTSDRLYFEPLTLEDVLEIIARENPTGVIVQYGGQTPLRLASELLKEGVPIIGTSPESIELTEDRQLFSALLDKIGLKQSESGTATNSKEAREVAEQIGFPLVVRPSFVLGGRAMAIITDQEELSKYIEESVEVSFDRPVLLDRYLSGALEIDVDAVCDGEDVVVAGIIEHVERAGIHSGDSGFILPSKNLSHEVCKEIEQATHSLARACDVRGLMNVQFALNQDGLYVLEVNPRASRSVPFVSKVMGVPWAKVAARVMAGESLKDLHAIGDYGNIMIHANYTDAVARIPYFAVKEVVFPFIKFQGVDTVLGPEMRSTGEVMGIDSNVEGSFIRALDAVGMKLPTSGSVFFSLKDEDKKPSLEIIKRFAEMGFEIVATRGTAKFLMEHGVESRVVNKVADGSPHIVDDLQDGKISLVINTPEGTGPFLDSRTIRSTATQLSLPLFTTVSAASIAVDGISKLREKGIDSVLSLQEYLSQLE